MFPDCIMSINIRRTGSLWLVRMAHLDVPRLNCFPGTGRTVSLLTWPWFSAVHGDVISGRQIIICGAIFGVGASQDAAAGKGWSHVKPLAEQCQPHAVGGSLIIHLGASQWTYVAGEMVSSIGAPWHLLFNIMSQKWTWNDLILLQDNWGSS